MSEKRKIIKIDEGLCDGCGLCVPSCAEGAIRIIDGKARLVSETFCDGLGACLGECPRGALTIEERDAVEFDEEAAKLHVGKTLATKPANVPSAAQPVHGGCPGSRAATIERTAVSAASDGGAAPSQLGNWPVQLGLVPTRAPYYEGADLLIAADCVPFAFSGFHEKFLTGKTLIIGCPKLDDADAYKRKLASIFAENDIKSVEVLYMEVPCCFGLVHLVSLAVKASGKDIPAKATKVGIRGALLESKQLDTVGYKGGTI